MGVVCYRNHLDRHHSMFFGWYRRISSVTFELIVSSCRDEEWVVDMRCHSLVISSLFRSSARISTSLCFRGDRTVMAFHQ